MSTCRRVMDVIRRATILAVGVFSIFQLGCSPETTLLSAPMSMTSTKWNSNYVDFGVSPDGKTIVFTGSGKGGSDLYLLDLTTSRVRAVTHSPEAESSPQFSPDGKQIVYAASVNTTSNATHIFVSSLDGTHCRQLTHGKGVSDTMPSFSPNGVQIVFARATKYGPDAFGGMLWDDYDIYVMDKDGSHLRRLTNMQYFQAVSPKMAPQSQTVIYNGVLHSDGTRDGDSANPGFDVFQVDAVHPSQPSALNSSGFAFYPVFSASGNEIYFLSYVNLSGGYYDYGVWVMDSDGKHSRQLTHTNSYLQGISIAPDGEHVFVLSDKTQTGRNDLEEVRLSDGHLRRIADSSLFDDPLHWTPSASE